MEGFKMSVEINETSDLEFIKIMETCLPPIGQRLGTCTVGAAGLERLIELAKRGILK